MTYAGWDAKKLVFTIDLAYSVAGYSEQSRLFENQFLESSGQTTKKQALSSSGCCYNLVG